MKKFLTVILTAVMIFTIFAFSSCGAKEPDNVNVYMPDGAPALAMAQMMAQDAADDNMTFNVVAADAIKTYVTGNDPKADLCILPVNLASKLLGSGSQYKMLGAVTHGNLYLLTVNGAKIETTQDLQKLKGKKVGVIQMANVPGLTFKIILQNNNIAFQELTSDTAVAADKVNLQGIADPATGVSPAGGCDYYVAAEPMVTAKTSKTPLTVAGDLQSLYGEGGYVQAVLVAKTQFVNANKKWTDEFLNKMTAAAEWIKSAEAADVVNAIAAHLPAGQAPTFNAQNLTAETIDRCGIKFVHARDCKEGTKTILQQMKAISADSVGEVKDEFFYQ